ncbi:hypothetical protein CVT25_011524 [Psilocybe cyanescens]|uniref:Uncharacterized protein n=1 Tax=Psilocybe cyanescens TaxID=93625 RepID=A0A409XV64_PSICY|nr:hypothetical protein CVT25_011524 [Psilocybe cyanescens]
MGCGRPSILTIEEAAADGHGRPDDWDDVIAGYECGSAEADVGSEEMAGGAAEKFGVKKARARLDHPDMMPLRPSRSMSGGVGDLDWEREDWVLATIAASPVSAEQRHHRFVFELPEIGAQPSIILTFPHPYPYLSMNGYLDWTSETPRC